MNINVTGNNKYGVTFNSIADINPDQMRYIYFYGFLACFNMLYNCSMIVLNSEIQSAKWFVTDEDSRQTARRDHEFLMTEFTLFPSAPAHHCDEASVLR